MKIRTLLTVVVILSIVLFGVGTAPAVMQADTGPPAITLTGAVDVLTRSAEATILSVARDGDSPLLYNRLRGRDNANQASRRTGRGKRRYSGQKRSL